MELGKGVGGAEGLAVGENEGETIGVVKSVGETGETLGVKEGAGVAESVGCVESIGEALEVKGEDVAVETVAEGEGVETTRGVGLIACFKITGF